MPHVRVAEPPPAAPLVFYLVLAVLVVHVLLLPFVFQWVVWLLSILWVGAIVSWLFSKEAAA